MDVLPTLTPSEQYETPTAEQRREVRRQYRALAHELDANRAEYVQDVSKLAPKIELMNTIHSSVKTTSESALDSRVLLQATQIVNERIQSMKVGRVLFDVSGLMGRLVDMGDRGQDPLAEIGNRIGNYVKRAPGVEFMMGPMDVGVRKREVKQRQARHIAEKSVLQAAKTTELDLERAAEVEAKQTTKQVKKVFDALCRLEEPVPLFEFVLHPRSFAQTIENLFYVSFLVKDGRAYVDVGDEPTVCAIGKNVVTSQAAQERFQWIPSITMQNWKALVRAYGMEHQESPKYVAPRSESPLQ